MKRTPLPARFPPFGAWPVEMRADMTAAYLDYRDTAELKRAIVRGDAPPPTSLRGTGRAREPIWARQSLDRRLALPKTARQDGGPKVDLAALV